MTLSLGFRPRSQAEQLRVAALLEEAPLRVGLAFEDDGYVASCLRIAGRVPVWSGIGDRSVCDSVLERVGLAKVEDGSADAILEADLSWRSAPTRAAALDANRVQGPLVTILVCTYNRGHLVEAAIRSALAQSWPCEVLVVDDGSTDATPDVLASIDGIRVLRQLPNRGKPAALALGLAEARGQAVLVLDDDDLLFPRTIEVLARALFAESTRVAVWSDTIVFDDATSRPLAVKAACRLPSSMVQRAVLQQIPAMPGATLIRKTAWESVGPLDPSLVRGQDMDLFLALSRVGPIEALPLPTFRYRSHDALRGSAAGQWNKRDAAAHRRRFLGYAKPVFRRRWSELARDVDRAEGHAWALGLLQRDLREEALEELARWSAPYSEAEAWVREQLGLASPRKPTRRRLVVVDDGDEGALEATLALHAQDAELIVDVEVPRDGLGSVCLYWPGTFVADLALSTLREPFELALSSAPEWAPIPIDDVGMLPPLRSPEALSVVAAVLDAPRPVATRPGLRAAEGPVAALAWRAREALRRGRPTEAMAALAPLVERFPNWRGVYGMTAEAFTALGLATEAAHCRARAAEASL